MTSQQDDDGLESLDADPYLLVNRDDENDQLNDDHPTIGRLMSLRISPPTTFYLQTFWPSKFKLNILLRMGLRRISIGQHPSKDKKGIRVGVKYYLPLYHAALNGEWESARKIIQRDPSALTARISVYAMTALHVAASVGRCQFVEKLVEMMPTEALAKRDSKGFTALHYAAVGGHTQAAKAMVRKNRALTQITDTQGRTPLFTASVSDSKEVLWYLSLVTTDEPPSSPFTGPLAGLLISCITAAGFYDIALYLLQHYPNLANAMDHGHSLFGVLANTPSAFPSGSTLGFWRSCIYSFVPAELNNAPLHLSRGDIEDPLENPGGLAEVLTSIQSQTCLTRVLQWLKRLPRKAIEQLAHSIKQVRDEKLRHKQTAKLIELVCIQVSQIDKSQIEEFFVERGILHTAASNGIVEIVKKCLQFFPDMIWLTINQKTILHSAVEHRQENIFNLLREKTARNRLLTFYEDQSGNILHSAARLPPSDQLKSVSGSALQIQRELQWFKEVEKFVHPFLKEVDNSDGKTPREVFTEEHRELVGNGEKWMKDTSNSCMVVSTLIATVVFAAAFTVPGGNDNNNGIPIFLNQNSFMVFAISDALALFSSSTSLLMFFSILTSRYAEEDFLKSLPKRLILGLATLFFAIATMMIAFSAALSIVLNERWKQASIPIASMACFPVALFAMLQLPLFIQMVQSTYGSGIFCQQSNLTL